MNNLIKGNLKDILLELEENLNFDQEIPNIISGLKKYSYLSDSEKKQLISRAMFVLSTLRNRLLITKEEQEILKAKTLCFFGLSVGSHALNSWMMESRANNVVISDPDFISATNLNRLNAGWSNIGSSKTSVVKNIALGINPNCNVRSYLDGDIRVIKKIFSENKALDLVVEQIDDLLGKIEIRRFAKKRRLPLIMATDVGDNVFLDIERYDLDKDLPFFNNRIKNIEQMDISKLTPKERINLSISIVGTEHNSERMLMSLSVIGKKIKTWPQLGTTATIAGSLVAKTARNILLNNKVESGRYYFDYDRLFVK